MLAPSAAWGQGGPGWLDATKGRHANPAFTLRVYAHAVREEESGLSFAEFGDGAPRRYTALNENGVGDDCANPSDSLVELGGIEPPTLRLPERHEFRGSAWN
jgi:hypothetical protein